MIDTNELRRLAQAATPGPWHATKSVETNSWAVWSDTTRLMELRPTKTVDMYQVSNTAAFIAAANPAAISELLDRLEAAEKERDALRAELSKQQALTDAAQHIAEVAQSRANQLQAKIIEMERQGPVGVLHVGSYCGEELEDWEFEANQCACDKLNEAYVHNPTSLPLYALPGTKGEEK